MPIRDELQAWRNGKGDEADDSTSPGVFERVPNGRWLIRACRLNATAEQ